MIVNLFSVFDPSVSFLNFGWFSFALPLLLTSLSIFQSGSMLYLLRGLFSLLVLELSQLLNGKSLTFPFFCTLFFLILVFNSTSLLPFVFPLTSQISIVFPLSILFWFSPLFFGWVSSPGYMTNSLLPQSTPYVLVPFILFVEVVSILIRPITLSVRLAANVTAGHLLLSILVSFSVQSGINLVSFFLIVLMDLLETAVSLIQSYVFFTLLSMYVSEL